MKTEDDRGFFHVCTSGTVLPWMFKDNEDFTYGVNRIGICCVLTDISVLTFSLMDNHAHFLLYGTPGRCRKFINKYKLLTGKWISHKYDIPKFLKRLPVSIILLKGEEDILETAAYIDRNAIMGGFRGILKTRVSLPMEWTFNNDGMIDPLCFLDIKRIEQLFKSPNRYLYYLVKKLEGKINLTLNQDTRPFVPDKSRLTLARNLKKDFASSSKQISRILHLEASILKDFI